MVMLKLIHASVLFFLLVDGTAMEGKDKKYSSSSSSSSTSAASSSPSSSSSSSSSTSSLVFSMSREGGGKLHTFIPAAGSLRKEEEKPRKKPKKEEEKKEKNKEDEEAYGGAVVALELQNNTEILAQVGGEATFICFTHHLSDDMVTWLRRDDDQLLTVGQQVYAAEDRFTAIHSQQSKAWELLVQGVELGDAGHYECQLTSHPPVTFFFTLRVTQAEAVVSGPSEVHIEEGSMLALECEVRHAPLPPVYIFWYHNSTMVNYGRQASLQVQHENYTSSLVVSHVTPGNAGTYTCEPHLALPANVTVHVVTGKTPAAMQHGINHLDGGANVRCRASTSLGLVTAGLVVISVPWSWS